MSKETRMVITGGGTGGHIYPALALADALKSREGTLDILFIGSGNRPEATIVPGAGWPFAGISVAGLRGKGLIRLLAGLVLLPVGTAQSLYHLIRYRPGAVVGMGGYVSGPVVAAAWLLRRKIAIHEQNLSPGWTNRLLGKLADLVMVAFPETVRHFPGCRVVVTGTPVRGDAATEKRGESRDGGLNLLVLGGSQGARSLNRMVVRALRTMAWENLFVKHQTGRTDEGSVREAYRELGVEAEVFPFTEEVGRAYRWADLVVCRAGASTIAELALNGCPSILVPFPSATGSHQEENARYLAERGAALMVEDKGEESGEDLAGLIEVLRGDMGKIEELSRVITGLARPGAADEMAAACLGLAVG